MKKRTKLGIVLVSALLIIAVAALLVPLLIENLALHYAFQPQAWSNAPTTVQKHHKECVEIVELAKSLRKVAEKDDYFIIHVFHFEDGTLSLHLNDEELQLDESVIKSLRTIYNSFQDVGRIFNVIRVYDDRIALSHYEETGGSMSLVYTDDGKPPKYYAYPDDETEFRTKKIRDHWYMMERK
jgi:hypothetical protein